MALYPLEGRAGGVVRLHFHEHGSVNRSAVGAVPPLSPGLHFRAAVWPACPEPKMSLEVVGGGGQGGGI